MLKCPRERYVGVLSPSFTQYVHTDAKILLPFLLQVMPKRTNKPGLCITNRPPRGRGFRGRGRGASMRGFGAMRRPRYVSLREVTNACMWSI